VKLTFSDANDATHTIDTSDATQPGAAGNTAPVEWEAPDSDERVLDLVKDEFRIRFAQTWISRIGAPALLAEQRLSGLQSTPASGADYCIWLPGAGSNQILSNDAKTSIFYSVAVHDRDGLSPTSINFNIVSSAGTQLGSLQCNFPRTPSASNITFDRWKSIVGANLLLEVRP